MTQIKEKLVIKWAAAMQSHIRMTNFAFRELLVIFNPLHTTNVRVQDIYTMTNCFSIIPWLFRLCEL